jgi:hypothetical protein
MTRKRKTMIISLNKEEDRIITGFGEIMNFR